MTYDPLKTPTPGAWLALGEMERIALVEEYHRKTGADIPEPKMHAIMHSIVESQIAEGIPVVLETMDRLMREGLDRHDALHAIGSVLIEFIQEMLEGGEHYQEVQDRYYAALRALTKASWYKMYE